MIFPVQSSISGLKAAETAVGASAANIANMRDSGRLDRIAVHPSDAAARVRNAAGQAEDASEALYRPVRTDTVAIAGGGVRALVRGQTPAYVTEYDPGDPSADGDGLVARPNVDVADELVRMRQARALYSANLAVMSTADEMAGALLDNVA